MCVLSFRKGKSFMLNVPHFLWQACHILYICSALRQEMGQIFLDFPEEPTCQISTARFGYVLMASRHQIVSLCNLFWAFWRGDLGRPWGRFFGTGEAAHGATGILAKSDEQGRMSASLGRSWPGDWWLWKLLSGTCCVMLMQAYTWKGLKGYINVKRTVVLFGYIFIYRYHLVLPFYMAEQKTLASLPAAELLKKPRLPGFGWQGRKTSCQAGSLMWEILIWMFPKIVVPPKSFILIGFSIINHPFWSTPIFGNIHISRF